MIVKKCKCGCGQEIIWKPFHKYRDIRYVRGHTRNTRIKGISLWQGRNYIYDQIRKKKIPYARYLMEQYLGRKLKSTEIVHHINGNKIDDRIENFEIMGWGEHTHHHRGLKPQKFKKFIYCKLCGKQEKITGGAQVYCRICSKKIQKERTSYRKRKNYFKNYNKKYRKENKEKIREYNKEYEKNNKEKRNLYRNQWRKRQKMDKIID